MQTVSPEIPDLKSLTAVLAPILDWNGSRKGVIVEHRETNPFASTFPSELVTCRFGDGSKLRLLCKYGGNQQEITHGHRGGVPYEAAVYREVLESSQTSAPGLYGNHTDSRTGKAWIVIEYLEGSKRVNKLPDSMPEAARWIGRFHAAGETLLATNRPQFLTEYDQEYFVGWVRRTLRYNSDLHRRFSWLPKLCDHAEEIFAPLLSAPLTIIHGEFYPHNILVKGQTIYPVDWESAAISSGEIDLAALTDCWPQETTTECEIEYQRTRWPDGAPSDFHQRLQAARLYLPFRWLGDPPQWNTRGERIAFGELLRAAGERLGII
jgi:hypothetical protein